MDLRLQCPDYRYLLNENDKLIASIEGYRIDIPFCARKGKKVTISSWNTAYTPSVEREIYMFTNNETFRDGATFLMSSMIRAFDIPTQCGEVKESCCGLHGCLGCCLIHIKHCKKLDSLKKY